MNQQIILLFSFLFALIVCGVVFIQGLGHGANCSRGRTFQRDKNPIWFWFTAIVDLGILIGCLWFALHTLALAGGLSIVVPFPRF